MDDAEEDDEHKEKLKKSHSALMKFSTKDFQVGSGFIESSA